MSKPFRWSVAKREQLGRLISDIAPADLSQADFLIDLRAAVARVLALADNADLAFIGRTPENLFDYLSGVLCDHPDAPTLHLVQFSLRWAGHGGVEQIEPDKRRGLFSYFKEEGVDANTIAKQNRPLALVDFVVDGGTMENFIKLLHLQSQETVRDWPAVQRKLKIIGLRARTESSPNTWRWQQHQDWLDLIPETTIKNVSAPWNFLAHLANTQDKVTFPHHQNRWQDPAKGAGRPTEKQRQALALAAQLYDIGRARQERIALAQLIARKPQMKQAATRALVRRLKGR